MALYVFTAWTELIDNNNNNAHCAQVALASQTAGLHLHQQHQEAVGGARGEVGGVLMCCVSHS